MNTKTIVLFSLLLAMGAMAFTACDVGDQGKALPAANVYFENDEFRLAGDCYREAGEWDKCAVSYLKAGRISELKWYDDPEHVDIAVKSEAMLMYKSEYYDFSGLGSDMGKCVYESGDTQLEAQLDTYHNWMWLYRPDNPSDPPFDMDTVITSLETKAFPPTTHEDTTVVEDDKPAPPAPVTQPTTTTEPPEPEGDMLPIIIAAVVILVLAVLVGAAFFFMKKKK